MHDFLPSIFSVLAFSDSCYLDSRLPITVFKFSFLSYFSLSFYLLFWAISLTLFSNLSIEFNFCSFIKTKNIFTKSYFCFLIFYSLFFKKKKKKCRTWFWSPFVQRPLVLSSLEEKSLVSCQVGILAILLYEVGRQISGTQIFLN